MIVHKILHLSFVEDEMAYDFTPDLHISFVLDERAYDCTQDFTY